MLCGSLKERKRERERERERAHYYLLSFATPFGEAGCLLLGGTVNVIITSYVRKRGYKTQVRYIMQVQTACAVTPHEHGNVHIFFIREHFAVCDAPLAAVVHVAANSLTEIEQKERSRNHIVMRRQIACVVACGSRDRSSKGTLCGPWRRHCPLALRAGERK